MARVRILSFLGAAACAYAQSYGGPAILSRGLAPTNTTGAPVEFRPFASVNGVYAQGLTGFSVDQEGRIPSVDSPGVEVGFGLYGVLTRRYTTFGLNYNGRVRHYSKASRYDGTDQRLELGATRQLSRHISLVLREAAGSYTRQFTSFRGAGVFDPQLTYVPTTDIFDDRTEYLTSQADLTIQKSVRLSFDVGGEGFLVRRRSRALFGLNGYTARGDVAYRTSQYTTIGVAYNFSHFDFTRVFGGSDLHMVAVNYAKRLSRLWEIAFEVGAVRVESLSLNQVAVDPVIAALTGQTVGVVAAHRISYLPVYEGRLARSFRHAVLTLSYQRHTNPGNGLFRTSDMQSAVARYSYTGLRRWNAGIDFARNNARTVTGITARYTNYNAGAGITRDLGRSLHALLRFDVNSNFSHSQTEFNRERTRVTLGIAWSPGDTPLALW